MRLELCRYQADVFWAYRTQSARPLCPPKGFSLRLGSPCLALLVALFSVPVASSEALVGAPVVTKPWARASIGRIGAAYVTIAIKGGKTIQGDELVGASSPVAARVEIHGHKIDSRGVARMRQVATVAITPGKPMVLKPGGLHLMLFGLSAPLKKGGTLSLTLHFRHAGKIRVIAPIRGYGARWHKGKGG
jgi:copper(I)-binding protein